MGVLYSHFLPTQSVSFWLVGISWHNDHGLLEILGKFADRPSQGSHASSTAKIRTFEEKKGDFLSIYKENVARLRQTPIIIKVI